MPEAAFYGLLFFVGSGWALFCGVVFGVSLAIAAGRSRGRTEGRGRIFGTHALVALVVSAMFPLLWVGFGNFSAYMSRRAFATADTRRAEWLETLPAIEPGKVREALQATFAHMPRQDLGSRNEVVGRVHRSLVRPDAVWSDSDLDAFDEVPERLTEMSRDPGIHVISAPRSFNMEAGATAWLRNRGDLAAAMAVCHRGDSTEQNGCRRALRDVVCGWCGGNGARCAEWAEHRAWGPTAGQLGVHPGCTPTLF